MTLGFIRDRKEFLSGAIFAAIGLTAFVLAVECQARGGQSADDCPPGSKDPDCATERHKP